MNLDQIATKCFILALFIRDDGERLLLGDGYYDFNQKLQHFQANTIANDVVEIQGDNGQLLAGQVMRSGAQKFEGYIGDATTNRQTIEQKRSDFMAFFRIKHFYKVIYIFPDGTAIQRQRGYLTDAPTIPEIFQKFPEYSIALNFEDANYYEYAEDEHGDEIYAHIAELALAGGATGGLVWDEIGAVTNGITWSGIQTAQGEYITITNELDIPAKLASVEMLGNATQTTYSGKNLCVRGYYESNATARFNLNKTNLQRTFTVSYISDVTAGNATLYLFTDNTNRGSLNVTIQQTAGTRRSATVTLGDTNWGYVQSATEVRITAYLGNAGHTADATITEAMVENGSSMTAYEPYVGGTASPNPDYPQAVNTVTGENVVKIEGKNLFDYASASDTANTTVTQYRVFAISGLEPNGRYTMGGQTVQQITDSSKYIYLWSADTYSGAERKFSLKSASTATFDANADGEIYLAIYPTDTATWTSILSEHFTNAQLELGSTATAYEPYQGQEFEVNLGKNLFDKNNVSRIYAYIQSNTNWRYYNDSYSLRIPCQPNTTYTLSANNPSETIFRAGATDSDTIPSSGVDVAIYSTTRYSNTNTPIYLTTGANAKYIVVQVAEETASDTLATLQLEKGSTASSFAPYFTPIELAKIGNYQDRIYKEDSKWYIEKQTQKLKLTSSINMSGGARFTNYQSLTYFYSNAFDSVLPTVDAVVSESMSSFALPSLAFYAGSSASVFNGNTLFAWDSNANNTNRLRLAIPTDFVGGSSLTDAQRLANWKTALDANDFYIVAPLQTPTTTEITNEALIAQLDALGASSLYVGANNIGTETLNAMPTLKIEYYTEYTLDGAGYEWEPGGNTARTIVTVAGVDSAWPIWTIQGGAQNPTLTNITTGQTISWQGFVPEGQTLTINMAEMTADLAGANVFEYITGEWLRLAPGNNTLVYNAGNADKPSTLSWNGVLA